MPDAGHDQAHGFVGGAAGIGHQQIFVRDDADAIMARSPIARAQPRHGQPQPRLDRAQRNAQLGGDLAVRLVGEKATARPPRPGRAASVAARRAGALRHRPRPCRLRRSGSASGRKSSGSSSGRRSRRMASMRRLRAMVKIQVPAEALAGSNSAALRHTSAGLPAPGPRPGRRARPAASDRPSPGGRNGRTGRQRRRGRGLAPPAATSASSSHRLGAGSWAGARPPPGDAGESGQQRSGPAWANITDFTAPASRIGSLDPAPQAYLTAVMAVRCDASALYPGWVMHRRLTPRHHRFNYRVFAMLLDLDELAGAGPEPAAVRLEPLRPVQLSATATMATGGRPARLAGRSAGQAGITADGRRRVLCYPRIFGYVFNPLSVWFCHDDSGALKAIVYEVHNTYDERHAYVLPVRRWRGGWCAMAAPRISMFRRFCRRDCRYHFRVRPPGDDVAVAIHEEEAGQPILNASFRRRAAGAERWRAAEHAAAPIP